MINKMTNKIKFNPILKKGLIKSIGEDFYYKSHPLTKIELFQMALQQFFKWQEAVFGSRYKYNLYIIKRSGFENAKDYLNEWAKTKGFVSYLEYLNERKIKLKRKGLCVECGFVCNNKKTRCEVCIKKHNSRERRRYKNERKID